MEKIRYRYNILSYGLSLFFCFCGFFFSLMESSVEAKPQKKKFSVRYVKPLISYLGVGGSPFNQLKPQKVALFEKLIRQEIEVGRFIYVKLPMKGGEVHQIAQKMVQIVALKSQGIAKMRAEWNSQFQDFNVTSEMLHSIQNQAYFYGIDISKIRANQVDAGFFSSLFTGLIKNLSRTWQYQIDGSIVIHKLKIFDCRPSNRKKSHRHARFCRGKKDSDFAGFAEPFKRFSVSTDLYAIPDHKRKVAFRNAVKKLGQMFLQKMTQLPEFKLHAPIMKANLFQTLLPLGKSENLKLNQGFKIYVRHISGRLIYKGYARVRSIGDNRMKMEGNHKVRINPKAPLFSEIEPIIVNGDLHFHKGMMAYEYLLTGVSLGAYLGFSSLSYSAFSTSSGSSPAWSFPIPFPNHAVVAPNLQFDISFDLSNSINLNEFYLNFVLDITFADIDFQSSIYFPLALQIGFIKKFHIRQFVWNLGLRGGVSSAFTNLHTFSVGGELFTGFEFFISPSLSFIFNLGFRAHFPLLGKIASFGPWTSLGGFYSF